MSPEPVCCVFGGQRRICCDSSLPLIKSSGFWKCKAGGGMKSTRSPRLVSGLRSGDGPRKRTAAVNSPPSAFLMVPSSREVCAEQNNFFRGFGDVETWRSKAWWGEKNRLVFRPESRMWSFWKICSLRSVGLLKKQIRGSEIRMRGGPRDAIRDVCVGVCVYVCACFIDLTKTH